MIGSFVYLSHFSGAPPGSTYEPAHVDERQVRSGAGAVSGRRRSLKDAAWLREGALARLLAVLDRDGEEARVVGGAVRNALLGEPIGEFDIATTAVPRGGDPARHRRGLQAGADRHRARHHHRGDRQPAVRGDDAARGRRDLRPPRQCALRPRLAGRRRAARLHHERAFGHRRRRRARLRRRACRSRSAARALHRRRGKAHRRGLSAHPALLPLPRRLWPRAARCRGACRLHRRARRSRRNCRASGCGWNCSSFCWRGTRRRRSRSWRSPACWCRCWAACPISRVSTTWPRSRRRPACRPIRCSGSARSRVRIAEDAERLWQRLRLSNAEHERLASMGEAWWRVSPADEQGGARAALPAWARSVSSIACCSPGRARPRARTTRPGARWRAAASTGPRRCFRSRPPISSSAACRRGRRSARPCVRPRRPGSRRIFRPIGAAIAAIAAAAAADVRPM